MRILITGCSSGGKSTLLSALASRGFATVPEPGRRILAQERASGGSALPWVDPTAFARRAYAVARQDLEDARDMLGPTFFDRGVLEAVIGGGGPADALKPFPYDPPVFVAPPWPEIYVTDADRPHGFDAACAEYTQICTTLDQLGVAFEELPKTDVAARVSFVLARLSI